MYEFSIVGQGDFVFVFVFWYLFNYIVITNVFSWFCFGYAHFCFQLMSFLCFVSAMPTFVFSYFGYAHFPVELVFGYALFRGYVH